MACFRCWVRGDWGKAFDDPFTSPLQREEILLIHQRMSDIFPSPGTAFGIRVPVHAGEMEKTMGITGNHQYKTVVFDMGGVLLDWDPRHLYRKLFDDEAAMEAFLDTVCTVEWNQRQDAGRPVAEAVAELQAGHPGETERIAAFYERWPETFAGPVEGTVDILAELRENGTPLYLLTNASGETFPTTRSIYPFLDWFMEVVVSGDERLIKPDRRIFELLLDRHGLDAAETIFIDDMPGNIEAARQVGLYGIRFTDAAALRTRLSALSLL